MEPIVIIQKLDSLAIYAPNSMVARDFKRGFKDIPIKEFDKALWSLEKDGYLLAIVVKGETRIALNPERFDEIQRRIS